MFLINIFLKLKMGCSIPLFFTARAEPEVMFMRPESANVVQNNCLRCHVQQVTQAKYDGFIASHGKDRTDKQCWECHKEVPHGKVHGISTVKYNIAPLPTDEQETVVPAWLQESINKE